MRQQPPTENGNSQLPPLETVFLNGDPALATPDPSAADESDHFDVPMIRDRRGRFAKGNKGGPGNAVAERRRLLRQAALAAVSPETVRDILAAVVVRALTGDMAAAKLVLNYVVGKSETMPDTDDGDDGAFA